MTLPTQLVLQALLEDPTREMYGLEICAAVSLPTGIIHPILARFEGIGWLESRWEEADPHQQGRPRRRYYRLTPDGIEYARDALARAHTKVTRLPGLDGGAA
ncbi:helix-turn-helix transcriptional regulator [Nonomuraea angiospora]|uniref:PadR family transcriptional regulator n=1 Tax=Nonomuraea angiospora TaxID=46172 RepID=UPI00344D3764